MGRPSEGGKRWTSSVGCLTATSVAEGDPGGRALSAPELNDSCSGPGTPSQAPAHQTKDGAGHAALSALTSAPQKPPPGGSSGEDARHATHRESPGKGRRQPRVPGWHHGGQSREPWAEAWTSSPRASKGPGPETASSHWLPVSPASQSLREPQRASARPPESPAPRMGWAREGAASTAPPGCASASPAAGYQTGRSWELSRDSPRGAAGGCVPPKPHDEVLTPAPQDMAVPRDSPAQT